jgi:hypothetical protein
MLKKFVLLDSISTNMDSILIKKQINNVFYKDLAQTIESYLFVSCSDCKNDFYPEEMLDTYLDEHLCPMCCLDERYLLCKGCEKFFLQENGEAFCIICLSVHCYVCRICSCCDYLRLNDITNSFDILNNILDVIIDIQDDEDTDTDSD